MAKIQDFIFIILGLFAVWVLISLMGILKKKAWRRMGIFLFAAIIPIVFEGIGRLGIMAGFPSLKYMSFMTNEYARLFFASIMAFFLFYSRLGFRDLYRAEEELESLNQDLESRVKERTKELSALLDTTIKTSQTLDLESILKIFSEVLVRSFAHHTYCRVAIVSNSKDCFEIKASTMIRPLIVESAKGKIFPLKDFKFIKKSITSEDIKVIQADSNILDKNERDFIFQNQFKAALLMPFLYRQKILGFAVVCEARNPQRSCFSRENIEFYKTLTNHLSTSMHNAMLFSKNKSMFLHTIQALAAAIDAKDKFTHFHSINVTKYTVKIAEAMNIPKDQIAVLRTAALLHDIGKIGIKDEILLKPGKLTEEEFEEIKTHSLKAVKILEPVNELKDVILIIASHHERYNGEGYPKGLKGEEIPLGARIIAVADSYDAMTSSRVYHKAMDNEKAAQTMKKCSDVQFDPQVVDAFLKILPSLDSGSEWTQ